jgi:shikimate kinase
MIGFMGTGKTVVGRRLAALLKKRFIDTDTEIERITEKTIVQIFAQDGAVRFRSEESLLVKKLEDQDNLVISTGGGIVLNPENVVSLKKNGILIALNAPPEVIYQRVRHKRSRPLLNKGDALIKIKELFAEREYAYDVAEYRVETGDKQVDEVVQEIILYLKNKYNMRI